MLSLTAAALLMQVAGPGPSALPAAWILTCDVGTVATPGRPSQRIFRVAPRLLQEWKPAQRNFGPNLCISFPCKVSSDGLQGTVSSASLTLTIRLDRQNGVASWRTQGASGNRRTSGPCAVRKDDGKAPV